MECFKGKQVLVTGAAGFIGSHLTDRLLAEGAMVTGLDNLMTGSKENLAGALTHPNFQFIEEEVVEWVRQIQNSNVKVQNLESHFNYIYHLASPASPKAYQHNPVATYMVNSMGTHYLLEMAVTLGARFLFTSTSEIYGDPLEHPQKETYWGNVNPVGPRACYDESKRFGEMVCKTFGEKYRADYRIVRIFNTYGPRMQKEDGRIIPTFISQALEGKPITVEGTGEQTRSYCYVTDLVEFLVRAMSQDNMKGRIVNIGNPEEFTVNQVAEMIKRLTKSKAEIVQLPGREEDITRRKPDITLAREILGFEPKVNLEEGLIKTIAYFREWAKV